MSETPPATAGRPLRRRRGGGLATAVRTNRKALAGVVILFVFTVTAAFPAAVTALEGGVGNPDAIAFIPRLHPGAHHWLGTTGLGQDVYAQIGRAHV